jgi:hypothetical protein
MNKFLIVLLVIILAVVGYVGYLGFIPGVSTVLGSDKPRDLGINYTAEDYKTADAKALVKIETIEAAPTIKAGLVWEGSKSVINNFSAEELTAVINTHSPNWKYFPVTDAQVKINTDGSAAISGLLHLDRMAGYSEATGTDYKGIKMAMDSLKIVPSVLPVYISGSGTVTNGKVSLDISKAELGRLSVPQNLITDNQGAINNFFSEQINAIPGLYIQSLEFKNGNMDFKGTMPEKVITAKK